MLKGFSDGDFLFLQHQNIMVNRLYWPDEITIHCENDVVLQRHVAQYANVGPVGRAVSVILMFLHCFHA